MRWKLRRGHFWVLRMALVLAPSAAGAEASKTHVTWTLRQEKKADGWVFRTCSVLRLADEGARSVSTLVVGTVDGIVQPLVGGDEFLEAATGLPATRVSPDLLADMTTLEVRCTVERSESRIPMSMICEGGGSAVAFSVGKGATTKKFSGSYGGPEGGVFSMKDRGSKCIVTSEALLEGIPVVQRPERVYAPSQRETLGLRARSRMRYTLRDVLLAVGPGYRSWGSSTGSLTWRFSSGPALRTNGAPSSLDDRVFVALE